MTSWEWAVGKPSITDIADYFGVSPSNIKAYISDGLMGKKADSPGRGVKREYEVVDIGALFIGKIVLRISGSRDFARVQAEYFREKYGKPEFERMIADFDLWAPWSKMGDVNLVYALEEGVKRDASSPCTKEGFKISVMYKDVKEIAERFFHDLEGKHGERESR